MYNFKFVKGFNHLALEVILLYKLLNFKITEAYRTATFLHKPLYNHLSKILILKFKMHIRFCTT